MIEGSPSLRPYPAEVLAAEYGIAREKASMETTVFVELIPDVCPYSIEQIVDPAFLPGDL